MTGAPRGSDQAQQPDRRPLFYGSKIVLVESRRNFRSPPMIIHKVERGRLVEDARSPVSQMQKIALQLKPSVAGGPTQFLKADVGHYSPVVAEGGSNMHFDDSDGSPELAFEALENARISRTRARDTRGDGGIEIDDAFCWTIVGISGFTYSYSLPSECPDPVRYIGPIPRAADIFVAKGGGRLEMCALNFDPTQMQLVLNKTALCLCTPHENGMSVRDTHSIQQKNQTLASAAAISRVGGGASAKRSEADPANKPDDGTIHTFQLPPNTQPGILFIRRTDGVLYHTKWELKQNPASCILEAVACMLDI
ncbi:hypothetical protein EV175_001911 [Coemansia sp. RSA 1933]|nr:hypothetical protein EV175_001911 [Coemansia sp. RSA 1933]